MKRRFIICIAALLITLFCAVSLAACGDEEQDINEEPTFPTEAEIAGDNVFTEGCTLDDIYNLLVKANNFTIEGRTSYIEGDYEEHNHSFAKVSGNVVHTTSFNREGLIEYEYYYFIDEYLTYNIYVNHKEINNYDSIKFLSQYEDKIDFDLGKLLYTYLDLFLHEMLIYNEGITFNEDWWGNYVQDGYINLNGNSFEFGCVAVYEQDSNCYEEFEYKIYAVNATEVTADQPSEYFEKAVWAPEVIHNGIIYSKETDLDGSEYYYVDGQTADYVEGTMPETTINTLPVRERN